MHRLYIMNIIITVSQHYIVVSYYSIILKKKNILYCYFGNCYCSIIIDYYHLYIDYLYIDYYYYYYYY